jgi:hypothetical protein
VRPNQYAALECASARKLPDQQLFQLHQPVGAVKDGLLAAPITNSDSIGIRLANLELRLDAASGGIRLALPACHAKFSAAGARGNGLRLEVRDGPLRSTEGWRSLFHDAETWQLWLDGHGRRVFAVSRHCPPPRQIAVDVAFRSGEVVGEIRGDAAAGQPVNPLQDIDMASSRTGWQTRAI